MKIKKPFFLYSAIIFFGTFCPLIGGQKEIKPNTNFSSTENYNQYTLDDLSDFIDFTPDLKAFSQDELLSANFQPTSIDNWYTPSNTESIFGISTYNTQVNDPGIRNAFFYSPTTINYSVKPIVVIVVHGTGFDFSLPLGFLRYQRGGALTKDYFDIEAANFKGILTYAKAQADKAHTSAQVVSFQWSGANNSAIRIHAGHILKKLVLERYKEFRIITLSHSHGGNVVNVASSLKDSPFIDTMIQIATPVRDPQTDSGIYVPQNFGTLFQFWSSDDWVVPFGAVSSWGDVFSSMLFTDPTRNIRKFVLSAKAGEELARAGYNHLIGRPVGLVYNIRTQIDGELPGHSAIKLLAPYLISVCNTILGHYKLHTDLDLNIETKTHESFISIRHSVQEDTCYKDFLKNLIKENPRLANRLVKTEIIEQVDSDVQKALYARLYKGRDINKHESSIRSILRKITSVPTNISKFYSKITHKGKHSNTVSA